MAERPPSIFAKQGGTDTNGQVEFRKATCLALPPTLSRTRDKWVLLGHLGLFGPETRGWAAFWLPSKARSKAATKATHSEGGFSPRIDGLCSWLMRIVREIGYGTSVQALWGRGARHERTNAQQAALLV